MEALDTPPADGLLELHLPLAPVSQQARPDIKTGFKDRVRAITVTAKYLLTGDVKLSVEWLVSEKTRYETDRSPDIDNILKPLIDSFVGPTGLLIDDNQLQEVSCSWVDWDNDEEHLRVELRFIPDEWISKQDLVFVQFNDGLCLPIPESKQAAALAWLEAYSVVLKNRKEADAAGLPYKWARIVMPNQRVFHRTRIHGFTVYSEEDFRAICHREL